MHLLTVLATFAATVLAAPTDSVLPLSTNITISFPQPTTTTTTTTPTPSVFVKNHCPFPVYITSVGLGGPRAPTQEISAGATWSEPQYWSGTGTALDITRYSDGLWASAPVLVLGYTYTPGTSIYYDINVHAGNPFPGGTVKLSGAGGDTWWNGEAQPPTTKSFLGETDLTLDLCF